MAFLLDGFNVLDPLDISGAGAAESQIESSQQAADTLRLFFDQAQQNLQPFLDVGNRALPGLETAARPGSFFDIANTLRPTVEGITEPVLQDQLRTLGAGLGARGLTRSGFAGQAAADIQGDLDLSLLLQLQDQFTQRGQVVAGQGQQAGGQLAGLGQQAAENIGNVLSQGVLGAQQATAAGQQNVLGLAGFGANFLGSNTGQSAFNTGNFLNSPNASQFVGAA